MILVLLYSLSFLIVHNLTCRTGIRVNRTNNNIFESIVCFILLFVFFGFRNLNILNDTNHYYQHYYFTALTRTHNSILDIDIYDRFEHGYLVYENIVACLFDEPYAIICFSALIITILILYNIYKLTQNVALALYFLFGTIMLTLYSGIRQGLASCIATMALIFFLNRKNVFYYYYPLILLASTIHSSTLLLILIPVIKHIKITTKNIIIICISTIVIFCFLDVVAGHLGHQNSVYLERSNNRETFPLASFMNFSIASLFLYYSYKINIKNKTQISDVWWWISILNVIVLALDMRIQIMSRFSTFFYTISICLFIRLLNYETNESHRKKYLLIICITIFAKILITQIYRPEWVHLYPYSFYDSWGTFKNIDFDY